MNNDIITEIIKQSNIISEKTKRGKANYILLNQETKNELYLKEYIMRENEVETQRDKRCGKEIDKLAAWILKNIPEEIGKGNPKEGESAADVAIRLLDKHYNITMSEINCQI